MIEVEAPDGTIVEFPEGTPPEVMQRVMQQQFGGPEAPAAEAAAPADGFAPSPAPQMPDEWDRTPTAPSRGAGGYAIDTGLIASEGARKGMSAILGAPVDLVNAAPMLANLLPGVDGVGPISDKPVGGSEFVDAIMSGFGLVKPAPEPKDAMQRVAGRVGAEVGATIPFVGAGGMIARKGVDAVREMGPIARTFGEPMAVAPARTVGREASYALGAGAGAGVSNEIAGNEQFGDNFWSDFIGSLAGATAVGTTNAALGAVGNVVGGATGSPSFVDDVAGEDVALRLAASSTELAEQFAANGGKPVDARGLAAKLRRPSEVEQVVPGYKANIADRSGDPGMATFAFNQDGISPGAANSRRASNTRAINDRMEGFAPGGDPALFRAELDAARDVRIAQATDEVDVARLAFDDIMQKVEPGMTDATARGSSLRGALADRYATEQDKVRQAYQPINEATVPVDVAPLASRFEETTGALPTNDRERFMPSEARIPSRLVEPEVPPSESAILGPDGRPLIKPGTPARGEVPLNEVTSIRGGLTDDVRAARATPGQANKARVTDLYRKEVDDFVDQAVPAELREQLDTARATRRDVADRFERPGTGIAETLRTREGGGYALDDSAVPGRFVQPDSGRVTDFRAMMQEAGADPRARSAVTDEVLARVKTRGLIDKPEALGKFIDENSIVLAEFPDLKTQLAGAGASRAALSAAEKASADVTKRLTTPGKSATASYLKFDVEATRDAINNLTRGPQPKKAVQELLETVGNTPEARENLRTAFWGVVKDAKKVAADVNGEKRWSVNALGKIFDDPKTTAVADELWADNPQQLADIKEVFAALANAEVSGRARAAGSSGTGQILKGGYDPSLSATSLASRMRSVNRGQMTPGIALIDIGSTWLRNRSKQVQARAIDAIASAAVNNPEMAADLLEKFNPADFAAKRRMLTQKYGVRATQIVNLLDDAMAEDPTMDAITESDDDAR